MIPRVKLRASFSCLCSEGFIFPTSGSQTVTSSFVEVMEGGSKKFAPDSYISNNKKYHHFNIYVNQFLILLTCAYEKIMVDKIKGYT